MDTGLLGTLQIGVSTFLYPAQSWFVVIKADGTDGACRVAMFSGLSTGCILT